MKETRDQATLRLLRAAVIAIGDPPEPLGGMRLALGGAVVSALRDVTIDQRPAGVLVVADVPLQEPLNLDADTLDIPVSARRSAEAALETFASVMAVDRRASHGLSSPMPFVGFASDDRALIDQLTGKRVDQPLTHAVSGAGGRAGILTSEVLAGLRDRLDGLALLAEALNHRNALGRYLQFVRLFERAFRQGPYDLTGPLVTFLAPSTHNFMPQEVEGWMAARPEAVHADRRQGFILEGDVRPFIARVEEAAFDVLINKLDWRQPTTTRRTLWSAASGSAGPNADIFLTQGRDASLPFTIFDGFRAYPLMLAGPLEDFLPEGVWLQGDAHGGTLTFLPAQANQAE